VKIAIVADIHGNLEALNAVIADLPSTDEIVCCGDIVGYYPDVNQTCARLREINASVIRGNHDGYVIGKLNPRNPSPLYRTEWTRKELDKDHINWLNSLPESLEFNLDAWSVYVRHANPWDEETYLYQDSPYLSDIVTADHELYVFGHTHHPMIKNCGGGIILNPGSVGQPRDRNPKASYALFETDECKVSINRVSYPVAAFQNRLKKLKWENPLIEILNRKK
jgi:putative phosphoesterase